MVGEIRDAVTAETAVHAANSGHLVLATLHSPFAANCINTMLALGVNQRFLATSFLGAVSQRLIRKLCSHCKSPRELATSPYTFEDVRPGSQQAREKRSTPLRAARNASSRAIWDASPWRRSCASIPTSGR